MVLDEIGYIAGSTHRAGIVSDVVRLVQSVPPSTPCPAPRSDEDLDPGDPHGAMITAPDTDACVWIEDRNDGQTHVIFRYGNDLADMQERSVLTVDEAEERGRVLLAAVQVARPPRAAPAKSRTR